jgi:hypothetical protein
MSFTVNFGDLFAKEWPNYLPAQKKLLGDFVSLVKQYGLDQTQLPGKLSPSWMNASQANFQYAQKYHLSHYHYGYPQWRVSGPGKPLTSDEVVHFQWIPGSTHIDVVDIYVHYDRNGNFYLPSMGYLVTPTPVPSAAPSSTPAPTP